MTDAFVCLCAVSVLSMILAQAGRNAVRLQRTLLRGSTMDWKRFDRARRSAGGPIEVDLIEAYAQGKIKRRDFVKRGTIIGLSVPFMGAIIAACGSDDDGGGSDGTAAPGSAAPGTDGGGSAATGGDLTAGIQTGDANSGLDPLNMLDLGTYSVLSQSFEYLVGLGDNGEIGATALGHRVESERRRQRLDLQAPRGRHLAGRHAVHLRRRRRHDRSDGRRWCRALRSRRRGRRVPRRPSAKSPTISPSW